MSIHNAGNTTVDGYAYRVIATNVEGTSRPHIIAVNGEIAILDEQFVCHENEGYSLSVPRRANTRFFNVYRAADGSFCMGSKAFSSNEARTSTEDSQRALFGLSVTYDETTQQVSADKV